MRTLIFLALLFLAAPAWAQGDPFTAFLAKIGQEAVADGVSPATVERAFAGLTPDDRVVELDQKQPETTITFDAYSQRILSETRIASGQELAATYESMLAQASARYGVQSSIIVALWGIESRYGEDSGRFNMIESLATLAYEGRRSSFFRNELIAALHILGEENIEPSEFTGSWAGATGQCQFMPSTFQRFAVDGDSDGRRDIWGNEADIFASISNYLSSEGWQPRQKWGQEVTVLRHIPPTEIGLDKTRSLAEWSAMGIRRYNGQPLPLSTESAALVQPDGAGGRSFLVYDNFRALMRWNRSTYFALSVGLLADRIQSAESE